MPLYMDVHTIEGGVTEADVAGAHAADLEKQDAHNVKYLRYWVDEEASPGGRPTAWPCWAGSACSAVTWTARPAGSTRRSRWPRATTGWPSCRGRRPCAVKCSWPGPTRPAPRAICRRPSP